MKKKTILAISLLMLLGIASSSYAGLTNDQIMDEAKEAVKGKLKDAGSANFRNVRIRSRTNGLPMTCGEVNSKNSYGGYGGFQKFITSDPNKPEYGAGLIWLEEDTWETLFNSVWLASCAS